MTRRSDHRPTRRAQLMLALTALAPGLAVLAGLGTRAGQWDWPIGYSLLTMTVAWWMAMAGAVAALLAVVFALKDLRRAGVYALLAVLVAGGTLGLFVQHRMKVAAGGPAWDVATSPGDPPGFSEAATASRARAGAAALGAPQACEGVSTMSMQVAPQRAVAALDAAGFQPTGAAPFRADGVRVGSLFGFTHDAVIRIRPAATDIRVSARVARPDGGEACRLTREIREALEGAA